MMPMLTVQQTTADHAEEISKCLDFATLETERIMGSDPMVSLLSSKTLWYGDVPLCSYDIVPPEDGQDANAWMMMTMHVKEQHIARVFIQHLGRTLSEAVSQYGRISGAAWVRGGAPRMLQVIGATFELSSHPSFIVWRLSDNHKLRRFA